jgi:prepilin peptidase CpaA
MPLLLKFVLGLITVVAGIYDLRIRRIPNWLNLSGIILGLGLNTFFDGQHGAITSFGGLLIASAVYLPLYALRGMGAGDVKLMAAVGAIAGAANWLTIFIVTALLGGALSLILVFARKQAIQTLTNVSIILRQLARGRQPAQADASLSIHSEKSLKMPHGAVIAASVALFLILNWHV